MSASLMPATYSPSPSVRVRHTLATVLMPLPACDFDLTEVAVSWRILSGAGHDVVFVTPSGSREADDLLASRGPTSGAVPLLRNVTVTGRILRADAAARRAYSALLEDAGVPIAADGAEHGAATTHAFSAPPGGHLCGTTPSKSPESSTWAF